MQLIKKAGIILSLLPGAVMAQSSMQTNPLLVHSNSPIPFDKITPADIKNSVTELIKVTDGRIAKIVAVPAGKQTVANTLMKFDELNYDLTDLGTKIGVIASTYADDAIRNEANDDVQKLGSYGSDLYLNEPLYKALKSFSVAYAGKLSATQQKFIHETLIAFEVNGMKLNAAGRARLKVLNDKLIDFGNQFDKNIAEYKDSVEFTGPELAGVPDVYMKPWKRSNGKYMVRVNGPNEVNITTYADNGSTRKIMFKEYWNRAYPANMGVLDSLFTYRLKFANELGYKTYAEYALVTKMAGKPLTVWNFLDDLQAKLTPHVGPELATLRELKAKQEPGQTEVYPSDFAYYNKKLLDTKYKLNTDDLKPYFEMNNTLRGMFTVYEKLFNLKINEIKGLPLWDPKLKTYELYMDGKKMGTFYLDLYPRPNKYTHFETAPISAYRISNGKEVLPVGSLICNFPEGTADNPSLLDHQDVVTLFHEFGHLIHFLVCHPAISSQFSFACKGDFVEAPSQFLENFCWNYDVLSLFAKNYKTNEPLPRALFDKLKATEKVGVSLQYIRQVWLAKMDFTFEDRFNTVKNGDLDAVEKNLYTMTQSAYPDSVHFICSFTHLNGYGANYYGYLWSKVYAQDIFSVFEKNGVLDQATGVRYRKDILQEGAQEDEMAMLRHFLGREPNSNAFLESLGLK